MDHCQDRAEFSVLPADWLGGRLSFQERIEGLRLRGEDPARKRESELEKHAESPPDALLRASYFQVHRREASHPEYLSPLRNQNRQKTVCPEKVFQLHNRCLPVFSLWGKRFVENAPFHDDNRVCTCRTPPEEPSRQQSSVVSAEARRACWQSRSTRPMVQ